MKEWTDGSLINDKALDDMDEKTLDLLLKILENVK